MEGSLVKAMQTVTRQTAKETPDANTGRCFFRGLTDGNKEQKKVYRTEEERILFSVLLVTHIFYAPNCKRDTGHYYRPVLPWCFAEF